MRNRRLERALESGNKRRIERLCPAVFKSKQNAREREDFATSSEWIDKVRLAIREAEEALREPDSVPEPRDAMRLSLPKIPRRNGPPDSASASGRGGL